jgi:predicted site-specific integrase-resolvase
MAGDTLMSSKQVFEEFKIPYATRHRLVKQGHIKTIRETPKGGMRFSRLDIVRFIETTGWKKGRRV